MQGSERVKKWPCSCCQKEFSTRANHIAHERTSCCNRPLLLSVDSHKVPVSQQASATYVSAPCRNKPPQPHVSAQMSIANDHAVSAPAQTNDSVIAATSAQLQSDGNRDDSDKVEHGCKPAVETQKGPQKTQTEQPSRLLEGNTDLRLW